VSTRTSACLSPAISLHRAPPLRPLVRARSSAGEHYVDIVGVTGSIPVAPTIFSVVSSIIYGEPGAAPQCRMTRNTARTCRSRGHVLDTRFRFVRPVTDPNFERVFCARVRAARQACGMTQVDIARALGVSRSAYASYETRRPLPHYLLEEFAAITKVDIAHLFDI
jgi:DNA-binding XRE family transcriptional regulator